MTLEDKLEEINRIYAGLLKENWDISNEPFIVPIEEAYKKNKEALELLKGVPDYG